MAMPYGSTFQIVHQRNGQPTGNGHVPSRWPTGDVDERNPIVTPCGAGFTAGTLVVEVQAPEAVETFRFGNHFPHSQLNFRSCNLPGSAPGTLS